MSRERLARVGVSRREVKKVLLLPVNEVGDGVMFDEQLVLLTASLKPEGEFFEEEALGWVVNFGGGSSNSRVLMTEMNRWLMEYSGVDDSTRVFEKLDEGKYRVSDLGYEVVRRIVASMRDWGRMREGWREERRFGGR